MKIKKFLAMVSLSAFALTNVTQIGVWALGESFERKPLDFSGTALTRSRVKEDIRDFKKDYFEYAELLSDRTEMEKIGLLGAHEKCERTGSRLVLKALYKIVMSCPWLEDDDCADLIRAMDSDPNAIRNDYDSYSDILQSILSNILRFCGPEFNYDIAFGMCINLDQLCHELRSAGANPRIVGYLNSTHNVSRYIHYVMAICRRLGLH